MKKGVKKYLEIDVLTAARERISMMFDRFENVCCSLSGGKDSTVLLHLTLEEAKKRSRKVHVFFLDQEAEYQATIDLIEYYLSMPEVIPHWYQVPVMMKNATSYTDQWLNAWGEGEKWMREKHPMAIKEIKEEYPHRFHGLIDWFEGQWDVEKTCFLVGLRAEESLNRFRAVTKHAGIEGVPWSTNKKGKISVYPLYDWTFEDIWIYISKFNVKYNKIYDFMYKLGFGIDEMRVSNLVHTIAFRCLQSLPEFEPETYNNLMDRIGGIHIAARYANESEIYSNKKLPKHFKSWKEYRDFLIETTPLERLERFKKQFERQPDEERVYQFQCKQLLLNDPTLFVPSQNILDKEKEKKKKRIEEWSKIL